MNEKIFIIAIIACFLIPISVQAADQGSKILNVPFETQGLNQPNNWCGLASLSMVLRYNGIDSHLWDIASYFQVDSQTGVPMGKQKIYVQNSYPQLTLVSGTATSVDQFKDVVKSNIDNGNPVILWSVSPANQNMKHYFVATGYDAGGIYIHDSNGFLQIKMMNGPTSTVEKWMNSYLTWDALGPYLLAGVNTPETQKGGNYLVVKGGNAPLNGTLWINDGDVQVTGSANSVITLTYDKGLAWVTKNHGTGLNSGDSMAIKMTVFNPGASKQQYLTGVRVVGSTDAAVIFSRNDTVNAGPDTANTLNVNIPIGTLIKTQEPYKVILSMSDSSGNIIDEFSLPELVSTAGVPVTATQGTVQTSTPTGLPTSESSVSITTASAVSPATATPKSGSPISGIIAIAGILGAVAVIRRIRGN